MNPPSNIPASESDVREAVDEPLDPLVESYRKLADVFHEVLSEQSLDDLLERIARTVGELIPYDDITFYEADEAKRELRAVYASGSDAEKVIADAAFSYGVGITGWAAEHREPVLANRAELDPRVRFVANTHARPRVADRRAARRARPPQGDAQHLSRRLPGVHGGRVPARRPVRRRGGARDRQRAHPRGARAPGADRPADRPLEPPRVPRAAPAGAPRRLDRPDARRARDARPRRLQARQRRVQPRDRRPRPLRGRVDPPRDRAHERHRLPDRRRGVRDHRARERPARRVPARRAHPGAGRRHAVRPGRPREPLDRDRLRPDARRQPA